MQIITHFRNRQFRHLPIQNVFEIMSIMSWSGHETEAMFEAMCNMTIAVKKYCKMKKWKKIIKVISVIPYLVSENT